jgi:hypothetical protein
LQRAEHQFDREQGANRIQAENGEGVKIAKR